MIDDADMENGPMMVVPGSHKGPIHNHHGPDGRFCGAMDPENCDSTCRAPCRASARPARSRSTMSARYTVRRPTSPGGPAASCFTSIDRRWCPLGQAAGRYGGRVPECPHSAGDGARADTAVPDSEALQRDLIWNGALQCLRPSQRNRGGRGQRTRFWIAHIEVMFIDERGAVGIRLKPAAVTHSQRKGEPKRTRRCASSTRRLSERSDHGFGPFQVTAKPPRQMTTGERQRRRCRYEPLIEMSSNGAV
jgi:hypothetical protein